MTSSLESGRRQIKETAQRVPSASHPIETMCETHCERAHKGSVDANAGLQVRCNPASSLERATGIEPATSSLGISLPPIISSHLPSFSATSGFPTCLGPHSFSLRLTITGQHSGQHHRSRLVTPRASDPVCLRLSRAPTRTGRRTTPCPRGNSSPPVHRISTGYLTQVSQVRTVVLLNISITEDGGLPWQP
jgi:hypothetical protein